jgi:hypothetical protein
MHALPDELLLALDDELLLAPDDELLLALDDELLLAPDDELAPTPAPPEPDEELAALPELVDEADAPELLEEAAADELDARPPLPLEIDFVPPQPTASAVVTRRTRSARGRAVIYSSGEVVGAWRGA